MRLTCPSCSAEYEIPDSVIPATGREVECSSCAQVWFQPGPRRAEIPAKPARPAPVVAPVMAPEPEDAPDDDAPRAMTRKLDDSVLSILREEAARELLARRTEATPPPAPDHIPAMEPPVLPDPVDDAAPSETIAAPVPAPPEPATSFEQVLDATPDHLTLEGEAPPPEVEPDVEPAPEPPPSLPDAARLAATLTRPMQATPAPVEATIAPQPALPVPVPKPRSRSGYGMGFGLAAMLALGLLAFYTLAPRIEPGSAISEWRQDLDQGRLWLHDRYTALRDAISGN